MKRKLLLLFFIASISVGLGSQEILRGYTGFWEYNRKITLLDLIEFYPDQLPYLRNEIYARYGRPFVTAVYRDYFLAKSWYRIRQNYSDAWLSKADSENAEFIRSIEQPSLNFQDTVTTVLKNIEYKNNSVLLTFTSKKSVLWTDPAVDFGAYGLNGSNARNLDWVVLGDWILVYGQSYYTDSYQVTAYKLDHKTRRILDSVYGEVEREGMEKLIQLQNNR